jgi:hypothetical protein
MVDCHISYIRKWVKKKPTTHVVLQSLTILQKQFEKKLGKCNVKYFFPTEFHHICSIRNSKGKKPLVEKKNTHTN